MSHEIHIITGSTGFVGSKLSKELLNLGDKLILFVRGSEKASAKDRVIEILNLSKEELDRVHVFNIDITKDIFDQVSVDELINIFGKIDNIWHLAANLSFKDKNKDLSYQVNIKGTENIVNLSLKLSAHLFYFSTAYMHGKRSGILMEDELIETKRYNNFYEKSKFISEKYLKEQIERGLTYTVFRPSIIIDQNPTYVFKYVSGYYVLLLTIKKLKNSILNFIKRHEILSSLLGFKLKNNQLVIKYIPMVVTKSYINLISVQNLINIILYIYKNKFDVYNHTTYHIVSPKPIKVKSAMRILLKSLNIDMFIVTLPKVLVSISMKLIGFLTILFPNIFETLYRKLVHYQFYLLNTREFDLSNIYKIYSKEEYNKIFKDQEEELVKASYNFLNIL